MQFQSQNRPSGTAAGSSNLPAPATGLEVSGQGVPSLDTALPGRSLHTLESGADFSPSRGYLPVFFSRDAASFSSEQPAVVLANAGGQLANARGYHNPADAHFAAIVREHERLVGPHALLFSGPQDLFVTAAAPEAVEQTRSVLNAIRATAMKAGIAVSNQTRFPESIHSWLASTRAPEVIAPLTVESHLFSALRNSLVAGDELLAMSRRNSDAYRKDAIERLWGDADLPLLESTYVDSQDIRAHGSAIVSALQKQYAKFDSLVLARVDGSGGFGIARMSPETLTPEFLTEISGGETLQVQGYVPLVSSPCIIGTVAADYSRILHVSEQVFSSFGTHAGNTWSRSFGAELREIAPHYERIAEEAFERLREAGIFGQVNIDIMICAPSTADQLGLSSNIFLREANIRPAGSSIMLRLRDGSLPGGEPVDRIHTIQNVPIPRGALETGLLPTYLENFEQPGTAIVLTNYNYHTERAQLALLGGSDVSSSALKQLEERLRHV